MRAPVTPSDDKNANFNQGMQRSRRRHSRLSIGSNKKSNKNAIRKFKKPQFKDASKLEHLQQNRILKSSETRFSNSYKSKFLTSNKDESSESGIESDFDIFKGLFYFIF